MQELFCKKRHLVITDLKQCEQCHKKQLSGFVDKEMCMDFNLCYVEERNDKY